MARIDVVIFLALCLLMQGVTSISVDSALAGLKQLNQVKDMLGKIENAIGSLRGGKHSRTYEDDDGIEVKEKKNGDFSETDERQVVDDDGGSRHSQHQTDAGVRRDSVDDGQFARQLKELVAVLRGTQHQCAILGQPCSDHNDAAGDQTCCRGLRCSTDGRCHLDCVADGQSCRHNWFCCDGRRCNRRNDDFICQ